MGCTPYKLPEYRHGGGRGLHCGQWRGGLGTNVQPDSHLDQCRLTRETARGRDVIVDGAGVGAFGQFISRSSHPPEGSTYCSLHHYVNT